MLVHDFIDYYARNDPDRICVIDKQHRYSYAQIEEQSSVLANALLNNGLRNGSRIAILGKNSARHLPIFMAASKAGCVVVPLNIRLSSEELAHVVRDSEAEFLFIMRNVLELYEALAPRLPDQLKVVIEPQDGPDWLAMNSRDDALSGHINPNPETPLFQLYTSGTTGKPKGAISTHKALLSLCLMNETTLQERSDQGTSCIACAPLFHIGGVAGLVQGIYSGQCIRVHESFEPLMFLDDVEAHSVQSVFLVPAMIRSLLETPGLSGRNFTKLKRINYGASPISESMLRNALQVFNCDFVQMYGMTETSGAVVSLSAEDHRRALNGSADLLLSCGRPNVGAQLKVVNSDGEEVPRGEIGEVCLKSDTNMTGYHNMPEATAKTLVNGWVHTGDMGHVNAEGYLFLKDRLKDVVVSGGENIYPIEVENALIQNSAVVDVAVIGVPDKKFGESLLAFIVLNDGMDVADEELIEFCRTKIAGYKIPRQFVRTNEIPRNPTGKILKKDLRAPYWKGYDRAIA